MPGVTVNGVCPVPDEPEVHLIDVTVDAPPSSIDVGDFTQETPDEPKENWQVAYDESYLDASGANVISAGLEPQPDEAPTRLVSFLYFVDFDRPLLTSFGPVPLPQPEAMPDRLRGIVGFEASD